jgi:hypothetical protein
MTYMMNLNEIVFEGTPIEMIEKFVKLLLSEEVKAEMIKQLAYDEAIFMFLNNELKLKTSEAKMLHIELVNKTLQETTKKNPVPVLPYELHKFLYDINRWSIYSIELIKYRTTNQYPNFKIDSELMWHFANENLSPDKGIKYFKHEYRRLLKEYQLNQPSMKKLLEKLEEYINPLEIIKQGKNTDKKN